MIADGLTKALGREKHEASRAQLGLEDVAHLRKESLPALDEAIANTVFMQDDC